MTISPISVQKRKVQKKPDFKDITLQDFSGGIKNTDNEIALRNKFSIVEDNIFANEDRSKTVRFGTKLFSTTPAAIVDTIYFADHIVSVLVDGRITKTTNLGVTTVIWDTTIAAALSGSPSAWSATTQCDFTEHKSNLVVCNGVDKPVEIDESLDVVYMADAGTGSNVNTPIAKYITTVGSFVVMAGVTNQPATTIYISSQGTRGTWPGDAAPNNAISFDVGATTGSGGNEVIGLFSFRSFLIVQFENFMAILTLGNFDDSGNHVPDVVDTREKSGVLNHRTVITLSDDLIVLDRNGVYSANRNLFGGAIEAETISDNVDPDLTDALSVVPEADKGSFAVHDELDKRMFFFLRQDIDTISVFVFSHDAKVKKFSVSTASGWNFQGGCASRLKRVFLFDGAKIFQYGNSVFTDENYHADFMGDATTEGDEIAFDWELPWMDGNRRVKTKQAKFVLFDTNGSGEFIFETFVNKRLKNRSDNYVPVRSQTFRCGDVPGYGVETVEKFGSGRRANEERLYTWPVRFRTIKFRFRGSTREPVTFNSFSLLYLLGSYVA